MAAQEQRVNLEESAAPPPEDIELQDAELLRRAEELRRMRAGDNKEAEPATVGVSSFTAPASAAASLEVTGCTEEHREDPDDWLVCIVLLERSGLIEEATLEREQLAEAFPDFEFPARPE